MAGVAVFAVFAVLMIMPSGVTPLAKSDVWSFAAHEHGIVEDLRVRGPADAAWHSVWVWRPPGPDSALIPVLYFLHGNPGGPGDAFSHGLVSILDERFEDGYPPFVVACPDGNGEYRTDTEWADSADGSDLVESRLLNAVIPAVEGTHLRGAARRAIAGFSMGGYGAMNIALRHSNMFGQIVSIAGYFHVDDPAGMFEGRRAVLAANSPDLHIDAARGKRILLEEDNSDDLAAIRGQAASFEVVLRRADIPSTLLITAGGHDWKYAIGALANALDFLADGWEKVAAAQTGGQGTAGHSSEG
jgi:S-formylglutathione hydrolase FrmB